MRMCKTKGVRSFGSTAAEIVCRGATLNTLSSFGLTVFIARCVPVLKGDVSVTRLIMLHWTGGYLGPGGVREILPYPSTLVGYPPLPFLLSCSHYIQA